MDSSIIEKIISKWWDGERSAYRKHYNRGWRSSAGPGATLDRADGRGEPDAWYDGYFDLAAGRAKYHRWTCDGTCGQH